LADAFSVVLQWVIIFRRHRAIASGSCAPGRFLFLYPAREVSDFSALNISDLSVCPSPRHQYFLAMSIDCCAGAE